MTETEMRRRLHVARFREAISQAAQRSEDDFFTWFDPARDKRSTFARGMWDFLIHIARPSAPFLTTPEEKVALEIGHGGGRLLAAAARSFKTAIGVDVHNENRIIEAEFARMGIDNIQLIKANGGEIPLENSSVDCVYSFIVLQHVGKYEVFKTYLQESYRVLKSGGIAVLYFGRRCPLSINRTSAVLYRVDRSMERFFLPGGYRELHTPVNCVNLLVSMSHARHLAKETGFQILTEMVSYKRVPDGIRYYGGQNGLLLRKA
ncbi:class I SAM-dependent methyltransferase [Petrachloros mirabilis]